MIHVKDCGHYRGGVIEQGETIEFAVKRELKEETGLTAKKVEFLKVMTVKTFFWKTLVLIGFRIEAKNGKLKPGDDAQSVKIVKINKIPVITFSEHKVLIREALKKNITTDFYAKKDVLKKIDRFIKV